ncbi:ADI_G0012240.mRNA.1.CDS.1 [Saccharomyces cerevisiae]|uniref:Tryptophan--tRNA ligase, mitochondrial n=5 Tax=Saccharomyces TaxID=4930 RepID=C8Z5I1_YEAS8|nr:Msw1p [Saccharomyces cerevisiae YJM993]AJP37973.1 Msw1p [Saccharomyces cerevisiae YJM1078]AJU58790.1 Msw1p [Saccharomyces cerevisiae YJM193]AJU60198.1 Msw1p [Saccharomyces cerevisiae YJM244]AJU60852.1 Msw1p [Saccharomyces cerevisiae YJM248]AJU61547.1 Msw1p [Saccharomyces cerevisiae YJM270]AJU62261.1 Msw1p [Saccharomyces cerevisiae YJM271]AJU65057.1 Msw1p [Saccharomyces cerevisiae YJM450]AJU66494.1 Msw1p [Saccharomyces cerevisiae YJM453]AJU71388.1 Msw1p [Saccharomyces cerevisiae YJM681]
MSNKQAVLKLISKRWISTVQRADFKRNSEALHSNATVFSMIQPTGCFHLGNYLGATRVWTDLCELKQPGQELIFGVADLHAITVPKPDGEMFRKFRHEAVASILAVGVDPEKASVIYQSAIPQHSELHWLLSTLASMGLLNRMTQWKSKSNIKQSTNGDYLVNDSDVGKVRLGLFSYPVLQAADILLYKSTHVPVGDDQSQHLELTRHLAEKFNKMYKKNFFPKPVTMLAQTKKVLSLSTPEKKMSKSDPNHDSVIFLNDEPKAIQKKIRKALTDSISDRFYYDPVERPGVSNLINIVSGIQRKSIEDVVEDVSRFNNYRDFKDYVSEVIIEELKGPRTEFEKYINEPTYLHSVVESGMRKAREKAAKNLADIHKIMGF